MIWSVDGTQTFKNASQNNPRESNSSGKQLSWNMPAAGDRLSTTNWLWAAHYTKHTHTHTHTKCHAQRKPQAHTHTPTHTQSHTQ